jgi:hypothetical protein
MNLLGLTEKELQTITAAMAGNFPESLSQYRMGALRKLAKAQHTNTQGAVAEARAEQREATIRHAAEFLRTIGRDDLAVALVRALSVTGGQ